MLLVGAANVSFRFRLMIHFESMFYKKILFSFEKESTNGGGAEVPGGGESLRQTLG